MEKMKHENKFDIFTLRAWRRVLKPGRGKDGVQRLTRKRDVFLAFAIVSLPLLAIAIILIAFAFNAGQREKPDPTIGTPELPVVDYNTSTVYYTYYTPGQFLLLSSWASNIATIVVAPFMLIFSYAVARELLQESIKDRTAAQARPPLLSEIMRGGSVGLWHWGSQVVKKNDDPHQRPHTLRVVNVAGFGLFVAFLLTLLIVAGDNWLHVTTERIDIRHFEPEFQNFSQDGAELLGYLDSSISSVAPSVNLIDECDTILKDPLPQNVSSAPMPCSLNMSNGVTNVRDPTDVYLTLGRGISQFNSSFNLIDFTALDNAEASGAGTAFQIVTILQNGTSHSLFFNPNAAEEQDLSVEGLGPDFGIDYVANTTSMTTQCTMATEECGIKAVASPSAIVDQNNISIPYHCYDDFSGNLGQTPATGHERAQGWNTSFYALVDGIPRNIPVQAQSNPFTFYAVAAVNSVDFQSLQDAGSPEVNPQNGTLVDVGAGFSAFALKCQATVFDVRFSLVNGSFYSFHPVMSSPQKASIVKAPLQVGFGQYSLYSAAQIAVLPNTDSIAAPMATAFSQTGMALASGAFIFSQNATARLRWTAEVTKVHKAPFWFLVCLCLLYSVFGMVMTAVAFYLRRMPEIRDQQARLMRQWGPELQDLDADAEGDVERRRKRESEDGSERGSISLGDAGD